MEPRAYSLLAACIGAFRAALTGNLRHLRRHDEFRDRQSARREWESRPAGDYACLADHNLSPEQLAANGIGPNDPRVLRILLQCAQATPVAPRPVAAEPAQAPVSTPYNPDFVVGGLVLGGAVDPDSAGYKTYACRPSVDFPGFSWCSSHHAELRRFGPYTNWLSILHSDAYKMAQISQAVVPAFFKPSDIDREIQRLSQYFGQEARISTRSHDLGRRTRPSPFGAQ